MYCGKHCDKIPSTSRVLQDKIERHSAPVRFEPKTMKQRASYSGRT